MVGEVVAVMREAVSAVVFKGVCFCCFDGEFRVDTLVYLVLVGL